MGKKDTSTPNLVITFSNDARNSPSDNVNHLAKMGSWISMYGTALISFRQATLLLKRPNAGMDLLTTLGKSTSKLV